MDRHAFGFQMDVPLVAPNVMELQEVRRIILPVGAGKNSITLILFFLGPSIHSNKTDICGQGYKATVCDPSLRTVNTGA